MKIFASFIKRPIKEMQSHNALSIFFLLSQLLTRIVLASYATLTQQMNFVDLPAILAFGALNDLSTLIYIYPLLYLVHLATIGRRNKDSALKIYQVVFTIFAFIIYLNAAGELMFWEEYGTRFNFIAVDYIVYTNHAIGTVYEDKPLGLIILIIALLALITNKAFLSKIKTNIEHSANNTSKGNKVVNFIVYLSLAIIVFYKYDPIYKNQNPYAQELSKNGLYELFSAFRNNTLDYIKFYPKIANTEALHITRKNVVQSNQNFINPDNIDRINSAKNPKKLNVVLIVVESLSAEFMNKFGNAQSITPYLDKMAEESVFFTNFYATGTRTVRGLEAILLSVPPTPGSSIIRRPKTQDTFTAGSVFKEHGYDVSFFYGGYGYFDNMLDFFSSNGYKFIDRGNLSKDEITFSNIWGVADEDIFKKALAYFDEKSAENEHFFSTVLTTSNHRPFNFPEGRIDLESGSGRAAGVKYTDYAIKEFIEKARTKPWFDNTVFVITADHCASSAGKTNLPVEKYHIPLFIYAPALLNPQVVASLSSQIDLMPTVFGILNFSYKTKFFGKDILNHSPDRAFIGTYQLLGYLKNDELVILAPNQEAETYAIKNNLQTITSNDQDLVNEAVSFYQSAYLFFQNGQMLNFK